MSNIIKRIVTSKKRLRLKVSGNSMLPLLRNDDLLFIQRSVPNKLRINDILLMKTRSQFKIHRLIYAANKYLITKGDNNLKFDGIVKYNNILGKVYKVKRRNNFFYLDRFYLFQSTFYFNEIVKVKDALEKHGVNFIFLKGLPLHLFIEKKHPQRIYADCDILVDRTDYGKIKEVLEKLGYKIAESSYSRMHNILKDKPTEYSFRKDINNFPVIFDVHLEPVFLMNQLGGFVRCIRRLSW